MLSSDDFSSLGREDDSILVDKIDLIVSSWNFILAELIAHCNRWAFYCLKKEAE